MPRQASSGAAAPSRDCGPTVTGRDRPARPSHQGRGPNRLTGLLGGRQALRGGRPAPTTAGYTAGARRPRCPDQRSRRKAPVRQLSPRRRRDVLHSFCVSSRPQRAITRRGSKLGSQTVRDLPSNCQAPVNRQVGRRSRNSPATRPKCCDQAKFSESATRGDPGPNGRDPELAPDRRCRTRKPLICRDFRRITRGGGAFLAI
jgi:hypothetical protein